MSFEWRNQADRPKDDVYGTVQKLVGDGMEALRHLFPGAHCDGLNFVLFSTSGTSGHYGTIEDAERAVTSCEEPVTVTFVVVQPRLVCLRYGNVLVRSMEEAAFLKALRSASWKAARSIGDHVPF